ncbi:hypothetical protein AVEN_203833-1 [Araneus ventricosus]|uniref:Uncharacterized protein n=1 Tax=Araneus ventricosus TaxID=182803 RepID=A0A4Y2HY31_ARAVE|nr:hypothetical protein AVEN_203833-1 [Araneus ventricosus]
MGQTARNRGPITYWQSNPLLRLLLFPPSEHEPLPVPISSSARSSTPRIYTGFISAIMTRQSKWISNQVRFSNFRSHHTNSHWIFLLTTWCDGICVMRSGRECSA